MFSASAIISRTNEKGEQVFRKDPKDTSKCLRLKVTEGENDFPHIFKLADALCLAFGHPLYEADYIRWLLLVSRCRTVLPYTVSGDLLYVLEDTTCPLENFSLLTEADSDLITFLKEAPRRVDGESTSRKQGTYALFSCAPIDPFDKLLEALYMSWIHKAAPLSLWKVYYAPKGEFPTPEEIKQFDGIVLTGSSANIGDAEHEVWQVPFMKVLEGSLNNPRTKDLGICFGHQIIAKTLGGTVLKRDGPFIAHVETIELTPEVKGLPCFQRFIAREGKTDFKITQAHGYEVTALPPKAVLCGTSKTCATEVYSIGDRVLCLQGHPEYSTAFVNLRFMIGQKITQEEAYEKWGSKVAGNEGEKILPICTDFLFSETS